MDCIYHKHTAVHSMPPSQAARLKGVHAFACCLRSAIEKKHPVWIHPAFTAHHLEHKTFMLFQPFLVILILKAGICSCLMLALTATKPDTYVHLYRCNPCSAETFFYYQCEHTFPSYPLLPDKSKCTDKTRWRIEWEKNKYLKVRIKHLNVSKEKSTFSYRKFSFSHEIFLLACLLVSRTFCSQPQLSW